jgi:hypothetical protein
MLLLPLTSLASATSVSFCSITPVDASCQPTVTGTDLAMLRFTVSCETHSAPPGGPGSISPKSPYDGTLRLLLDGVEVAGPVSPTARCGAGGTFEFPGPFVAGLAYRVRGDPDIVSGQIRMGPDVSALWHCSTNPDTCVAAARQVPPDLAPWLRLHACIRGQPCAPARADPLDPWGQVLLETGCASGQPEPCEWLAGLAPDEGWPLAALHDRGSGPVARSLQTVQVSSMRGTPVTVQWSGAQPLLSPASALPPAARSADGAVVATWSEAGLEVHDERGKLLWGWTGRGVQDVHVRPDGLQILVRFPTMFVRVPLDGSSERIGVAHDDRLVMRSYIEGTLVRPDGWPAIATRVSRCEPDEPESSCVSRTDLLGRFAVRGTPGAPAVLRLDGPSVGADAVEVEVQSGAQTPIPPSR